MTTTTDRTHDEKVDDYAWASTIILNERDALPPFHPRADYLTGLVLELFRECKAAGIANDVGARITELRRKDGPSD